MQEGRQPKRIQSVSKALWIIREVARAESLSLSEIAERMATNSSTVHHLAQTLVAERFLMQNRATKRYSLGPALLSIQPPSSFRNTLTAILHEPMVECSTSTGFNVWVSILEADRVLYLTRIEGHNPLRLELPLHTLYPAYCTSHGRVLLSGLHDDELLALLDRIPLKKYTSATCIDRDEIVRRVLAARGCGFAEVTDEFLEGGREVAVPIHGQGGVVVAALGLGAPGNVFTEGMRDEMVRELRVAAAKGEAFLSP